MKPIATIALMLNLGVGAVYAHEKTVTMTFSGSGTPSSTNLQPGTSTNEDHFAGNGTLGQFTVTNVRAVSNTPSSSSTCSGPNQLYLTEPSGASVFRFQDGSLLYLNLTQGSDCIDLAANDAHCTLTLQITGGTGRFKNASGTLTMTETVLPVLADALNNPAFYAATGEFTGTVSGVVAEDESQKDQ